MTITIEPKQILTYILIFGIGFGCCFIYRDSKREAVAETQKPVIDTSTVTSTTVEYVPKQSAGDADVAANSKSHLLVSVNNTEYEIPTDNVTESHKFENGKLVIESEETHKIDLTEVTNELAKAKYDRTGTADFGVIYADSDLYGGVRYNAKAWDAGLYRSVDEDKWAVGFHYKF